LWSFFPSIGSSFLSKYGGKYVESVAQARLNHVQALRKIPRTVSSTRRSGQS
jgi:hypothetical protein